MKRIIFFLGIVVLSSCAKNLDGLNVDKKNATYASEGAFFGNATRELANRVNGFGTGRLFVQHVTEVTYPVASNYQIANGRTPDTFWAGIYRDIIKDLEESRAVLDATPAVGAVGEIQQANQRAMIEILTVYSYMMLVETFGNVPYSEALDFNNTIPKYDDGLTIYKDLINRLSVAVQAINPSGAGFGTFDLIYAGNAGKWKKFGNSLKLRMGLVLADVDAQFASQAVSSAITSGVFQSNDDNALFKYLPEPPNTHPLWTALVQSGRLDFVAAKPIVDVMNDLNDPRRPVFFSRKNDGTFGGNHPGVISSYDLHSHYGAIYFEPTLKGVFLDYASVAFMLAEAAERGFNGNAANAQTHYNNAIKASFDYYNVSGFDTYIAQASVNYNSATGSWKEKIGIQKWIALFAQGFESWTAYRLLDFPKLVAPPDAEVRQVPTRFTYPIDEQSLNGDNYHSAASAVGGDLLTTKLFWDVF